MKIRMPSLRRPKFALSAMLLAAVAAFPALLPQSAYAAQVTERSIQMSSAAPSAAATSYAVSFTAATTSIIDGVVVDFCAESPIIGDATCTLPTGMNIASAAVATTSGLTGWAGVPTVAVVDTNGLSIIDTDGSASTNAGADVTFTITGITNPSTANQTFYARILTYTTTGGATGYTTGTPGAHVDEGGVALSTSGTINVSGTVQESLTFCVSAVTLVNLTCGSATTPTLTLGTGTPEVIDDQAVYTGNVYSKLSTNAVNGAVVRMKNSNVCGGLMRAGAAGCDIEAVGATTGSATDALAAGPKFGVKAAVANDTTGSSGTLSPQAPYNTADYGMDAQSAENVTTTYGDEVVSSASVLANINTTYTFGVRAAATTPAGVYTATISLIATGTY